MLRQFYDPETGISGCLLTVNGHTILANPTVEPAFSSSAVGEHDAIDTVLLGSAESINAFSLVCSGLCSHARAFAASSTMTGCASANVEIQRVSFGERLQLDSSQTWSVIALSSGAAIETTMWLLESELDQVLICSDAQWTRIQRTNAPGATQAEPPSHGVDDAGALYPWRLIAADRLRNVTHIVQTHTRQPARAYFINQLCSPNEAGRAVAPPLAQSSDSSGGQRGSRRMPRLSGQPSGNDQLGRGSTNSKDQSLDVTLSAIWQHKDRSVGDVVDAIESTLRTANTVLVPVQFNSTALMLMEAVFRRLAARIHQGTPPPGDHSTSFGPTAQVSAPPQTAGQGAAAPAQSTPGGGGSSSSSAGLALDGNTDGAVRPAVVKDVTMLACGAGLAASLRVAETSAEHLNDSFLSKIYTLKPLNPVLAVDLVQEAFVRQIHPLKAQPEEPSRNRTIQRQADGCEHRDGLGHLDKQVWKGSKVICFVGDPLLEGEDAAVLASWARRRGATAMVFTDHTGAMPAVLQRARRLCEGASLTIVPWEGVTWNIEQISRAWRHMCPKLRQVWIPAWIDVASSSHHRAASTSNAPSVPRRSKEPADLTEVPNDATEGGDGSGSDSSDDGTMTESDEERGETSSGTSGPRDRVLSLYASTFARHLRLPDVPSPSAEDGTEGYSVLVTPVAKASVETQTSGVVCVKPGVGYRMGLEAVGGEAVMSMQDAKRLKLSSSRRLRVDALGTLGKFHVGMFDGYVDHTLHNASGRVVVETPVSMGV